MKVSTITTIRITFAAQVAAAALSELPACALNAATSVVSGGYCSLSGPSCISQNIGLADTVVSAFPQKCAASDHAKADGFIPAVEPDTMATASGTSQSSSAIAFAAPSGYATEPGSLTAAASLSAAAAAASSNEVMTTSILGTSTSTIQSTAITTATMTSDPPSIAKSPNGDNESAYTTPAFFSAPLSQTLAPGNFTKGSSTWAYPTHVSTSTSASYTSGAGSETHGFAGFAAVVVLAGIMALAFSEL